MLPLLAGILGRLGHVSRFGHPIRRWRSPPRILRRRTLIGSVAVLGAALVAATTGSAATAVPPTARAVAVQVVVPGAATTQGGSSGSGSYAYRDVVSVAGYQVTSTTDARHATAIAQVSGISLLAGAVQVSAASAAIRAAAPAFRRADAVISAVPSDPSR